MNYEDICRYIFQSEGIDWLQHDSKKRDRSLVEARYISIFLGNWFYPGITWSELGRIFGKDHATAMHSIKCIKDLMFSNKDFRLRMCGYIEHIKSTIAIRDKIEMQSILAIKNTDTLNTLISVIDKMELVAKIYCEITNQKIIKNG